MQLILWGRSSAYNVQKVLWTLAELGLSYEHIEVGGIPGQLDTPEFLAMNPHGRIPILADGVNVIWESNAIVRYLSAKYSAGSLWSVDPAERSYADRWMDWELATFQPDFLALFWSFYRTPVAQRDQDVKTLLPVAKGIFVSSTCILANKLTWQVQRLLWATFLAQHRCIVILKWELPYPNFQMLRHGTGV